MDWTEFEHLRVSGFTLARRGYDKREVDRFLEALAEWLETDAAQELGDQAVQRKLELVGQSTAHILLTTEKEALELRRKAEEECAALRDGAEEVARETRARADEYARKVREEADEDGRRAAAAASAQAQETVEEGERRRAEIEAVVAELAGRRDAALGELERLRTELGATLGRHGGAPAGEARDADRRARHQRAEDAPQIEEATA